MSLWLFYCSEYSEKKEGLLRGYRVLGRVQTKVVVCVEEIRRLGG